MDLSTEQKADDITRSLMFSLMLKEPWTCLRKMCFLKCRFFKEHGQQQGKNVSDLWQV